MSPEDRRGRRRPRDPLEELRKVIRDRQRRVLLLGGAGLGKALTGEAAPTWRELLFSGVNFCAERHFKDAEWAKAMQASIAVGAFTAVAEEITDALGGRRSGSFQQWLNSEFDDLHPTNARLAAALGNLRVDVGTTNYDHVLSDALVRQPFSYLNESEYNQFVRGSRTDGILHIHGHYRDPKSIVFGAGSYGAITANQYYLAMLRSLERATTLVFVGCGLTLKDPDFGPLFEAVKTVFQCGPDPHYYLCTRGEAERLDVPALVACGIQPVVYGEIFDELTPYLESLKPDARSESTRVSTRPHIAGSRLMTTEGTFIGRSTEIQTLWRHWDYGTARVVSIVGHGGLGKTHLVRVWREQFIRAINVRARGFNSDHQVDGDEWVFDWTFFGDTGDPTSAGNFFKAALQFFPPATQGESTGYMADGHTLANRIRECRALLILDGLEQLQEPFGPTQGRLKHPGLRDLLLSLMDLDQGLCVVTTRAIIAELAYSKSSAQVLRLPELSPADGARLLKRKRTANPGESATGR